MDGAKVYRIADAARVIQVSRSKIYELASRGEIPVVRIGGSLRVPAAALDRWLEQRTTGGGSTTA